MKLDKEWRIGVSDMALNSFNPIRQYIENLTLTPNPDKPMMALSIGDPTVFGNLKPCDTIVNAVVDSVTSGKWHGYQPSTGNEHAREAVARYVSTEVVDVSAKDVVLCSGCSMSLDLCITVLANPGDNILIPRPGFPLYKGLASGLGIETREYNLKPDQSWQVDLDHMESLINSRTRAIIVNNPSNPCGAVFPRSHLLQILHVASKHRLPIIADEIYNDFVFTGNEFHYMASLSVDVPILSCGGLTKRFLVPGWRMGWIVIHDRNNAFSQVKKGLHTLCQRVLGACSVIQGALETILTRTSQSFFDSTVQQIEDNAEMVYNVIKGVQGLKPVRPQGAMYMMVGIEMQYFPEFETEVQLIETLVAEQSVFPLPGKCFDFPNYMRIVLTLPKDQMRIACDRMTSFFTQHYREHRA